MSEQRPQLSASLSGAELLRWYWLRSELVTFARRLGVSTAGGKVELTDRLAAVLDGREPPPPTARSGPVAPLPAALSGSTVLPPGQRSSQQLRTWFVGALGPGFRFDAHLRPFIAEGGHTLDECVAHWYATRSAPAKEIEAQFELKRFSRGWHRAHPGSSHAAMLAAWQAHRALPRDERT